MSRRSAFAALILSVALGMQVLLAQTATSTVPVSTAQAGTAPASNTASAQVEQAPLPDLATLVQAAQQRQSRDESIEKTYIYRESTTVSVGNGKHVIRMVDEVYWQEGMRVGRTVERDGKPLTDAEQKKEDERVRKFVERHKHEKERRDQAARPDDILPLSRLLELGTFSTPRRELVDNRPTIAIDFTGNPKAKTRNDDEKIIHNLAGTVWIDEADHTVQHMEVRLLKSFKVGGGLLASIGEGATFSSVKRRVNNEVWLPASQSMHGHFRFLLLLAGDGDARMEMTGYRKFHTNSTVLPGAEEVPEPAGTGLDAPKSLR